MRRIRHPPGRADVCDAKPLLPVAGEPFLDVLLFELGRHGFTDIVLLASFHSEKIRAYAADNAVARRFGMTLRVSIEPEQAGTGGAVVHALPRRTRPSSC